MADIDRLFRHRGTLYPLLNAVVWFALVGCGSLHGASFGLAFYASALFTLCTAPLLLMRRFNDRYALLAIFLVLYFLFFGALDFQKLLFGSETFADRADFVSSAELAILLGAGLCVVGYLIGVHAARLSKNPQPGSEWPASTVLFMGTVLWAVGTAAMIYFQVFMVAEKTNLAAKRGFASMGPVLTFAVMLGHLIQPLGLLMLAYGYAKYRGVFWLTLIVAVVCAQAALGFVTDIKLQAMMGLALVIMTRFLVDNRPPKAWLAAGALFVVIAFPIFQAYRSEVTGARGLDKARAFAELDKVVDIVLAARDKAAEGRPGERAQTFVERSSGKGNLEQLFAHVGNDVGYLGGRSLVAIPMAFVPRLLAPDKEDIALGQLFNKQVLKGQDDTYISVSHLGELYWNFAWPGVVAGMTLTGLLLGFVGTKFNLEHGTSLTRVLILLVTVQSLCMGFGGSMSVSYVTWMRSMAAVGLLHVIFARRRVVAVPDDSVGAGPQPDPVVPLAGRSSGMLPLPIPTPRFHNLLR
jgi:hypothetical protein